uniref:Uncharacterized protein n=1 Tax=Amphimedon queenslandica TaxID=400682 RepID=A0A1X7SH63_AMPQE
MKPIAVASFHEHVQEMHVDSDKGFEMEYKSVPMQTETSFDIGRNEGNKTKNRWANIFPCVFSNIPPKLFLVSLLLVSLTVILL